MGGLRLRPAVRAIVVDPDDRVVLVRFRFPDRVVWATPGGGIEPGEAEEQALVRELDEELGLGLSPGELGPVVWTRTHVVPLGGGRWDGQTERYRLQRVPTPFELRPRLTRSELRAEGVTAVRWWTQAELGAAAGTLFAPTRLPELLSELLRDGPPPEPVDVGV
jgi:8-oxo-dGTP diphosphatase